MYYSNTMIYILSLLLSIANAKTIKVAVLDTGFKSQQAKHINLCPNGHKDFTNTTIEDTHGHGTNISGLIHRNSKDADYCQIIIKIFGGKGSNFKRTMKALKYIKTLNVDVINYSGGGYSTNDTEIKLIKDLLDSGVIIVAAAGNDKKDIDKDPYYPAKIDKRIIVVGNTSKGSNYGKSVDIKVDGNKKKALGITLTGSSQSTAIITGKIINQLDK